MADYSCPNCQAPLVDFEPPGYCNACGARLLPIGKPAKREVHLPHWVHLLMVASAVAVQKQYGWAWALTAMLILELAAYIIAAFLNVARNVVPAARDVVVKAAGKVADEGVIGVAQSSGQNWRKIITPILYGRRGKRN